MQDLWKIAASSIEKQPLDSTHTCWRPSGSKSAQRLWVFTNGIWKLVPYGPAECLMLMKRGPVCVTRCKKAGEPNGWTAFVPDHWLVGELPKADTPEEAVLLCYVDTFCSEALSQ